MAKRKRLTPAQPDYLSGQPAGLETKSMFPTGPAPIAQVAGEAASQAALEEVSAELHRARAEGRMIADLPEEQIEAGYLVRDRLGADEDELQVLMESLKARGQQTPIEVVQLDKTRFGLISGWRRLTALRRLQAETGETRFGKVQAILRRPESASDAYVAMVEENEIRVGLSYYERAQVAAKAVEQGVFETEKQALLQLFSAASRAKRSKIRSFLSLYHMGDDLLRFPSAIPERLGLALHKVLDGQPDQVQALRAVLKAKPAETAEEELACLNGFLVPTLAPKPEKATAAVPEAESEPAINVTLGKGRVVLEGNGVSDDFKDKLVAWLNGLD